jgi:hypothetical protein
MRAEFQAVAGTKPAELLRRAIEQRLQLVQKRLTLENDVQQLYRAQGRANELSELLELLKP